MFPLLGAYVGSTLESLVSVDPDPPIPVPGGRSLIDPAKSATFPVSQNTTYFIAVDAYEGSFGSFELHWSFPAQSSIAEWMIY